VIEVINFYATCTEIEDRQSCILGYGQRMDEEVSLDVAIAISTLFIDGHRHA